MKLVRCALLPGIAVLFLLGLGASAMPATQLNQFDMRFEIFGFGGLHLLTDRTSVATSAAGYTIAMNLQTRGLAGFFLHLDSHSAVRGRLSGDVAHPEEYSSDIHRSGAEQQTRVDYGPNGTILSDWTSPATARTTLVAAEQIRGTVDQLTAYFMLERELADRNTCASVIPVYDGVHRYNLRFTDAPPSALPADVARHFPGPIWVCQMSRQDIGGPTDHSEGAYWGKIWYARLAQGNRVVPVQMEFDTELGRVQGYLAALHGPGVNLRLQ
jgi:hypothetical protein